MKCNTYIELNVVELPKPGKIDSAKEILSSGSLDQLDAVTRGMIQDYVKKLIRNSPKMRPDRIMRKVSEKFKINIQ